MSPKRPQLRRPLLRATVKMPSATVFGTATIPRLLALPRFAACLLADTTSSRKGVQLAPLFAFAQRFEAALNRTWPNCRVGARRLGDALEVPWPDVLPVRLCSQPPPNPPKRTSGHC
jgi:hypothetical protein